MSKVKERVMSGNDSNLKLWVPLIEQRLVAFENGVTEEALNKLLDIEINSKYITKMGLNDVMGQHNSIMLIIDLADEEDFTPEGFAKDPFFAAAMVMTKATQFYIEQEFTE